MRRVFIVAAGMAAVAPMLLPSAGQALAPVRVIADSHFIPGDNRFPGADSGSTGETVTIVNVDSLDHTFTSDVIGLFNSGKIREASTATITLPSTPGIYGYHCENHPAMRGTIMVS